MRFELLVVPDCPHEAEAAALFRSALAAAGQSAVFSSVVVVADPATAKRLNFAGSPSFFASGRDLIPGDRGAAIACRLYPTQRGISGLPDLDSLVDALQAVAAADS